MRRPDPLPQPDPEPDAGDEPLFASLSDLVEDGQTYLEAELDYRRKQLSFGLSASKAIIGLVALGLVLLFFALMALIMGLLLALTPLIGAWGSLGIVLGVILVATAFCFLGAFLRFRKAKSAFTGAGGDA